jgi:hypothetical protein
MTITLTSSELHAMMNLIDQGLNNTAEILGYPESFSKTAVDFAKENRQVLQSLKSKLEV